jgi:hypothetical protein
VFFGAEARVAFGKFAGMRGNVVARRGERIDAA